MADDHNLENREIDISWWQLHHTPQNLVWWYIHTYYYYYILQLLLHPFKGLFSRTTWISRHQKAKPFCILLEQEMMGWQWAGPYAICTSLQTDNHASTSPLSFYRPDAPPAAQPTASKHCHCFKTANIKILSTNYCKRFYCKTNHSRLYITDKHSYVPKN